MADHILINRAVVEQALEALAVATNCLDGYYIPQGKPTLPEIENAIATLRAALAEPVQEPVAWRVRRRSEKFWNVSQHKPLDAMQDDRFEVRALVDAVDQQQAESVRRAERPAPCARHCEATAFKIEIRRLQSELAGKQAAIAKAEEA